MWNAATVRLLKLLRRAQTFGTATDRCKDCPNGEIAAGKTTLLKLFPIDTLGHGREYLRTWDSGHVLRE
jgi:hypothetical protein